MELMKQRIALRGNYSDAELANPITVEYKALTEVMDEAMGGEN